MNMRQRHLGTDSQTTPARWDRRGDAERAPMYCRVAYTVEEAAWACTYILEGLLRDLSEEGCGIRGKNPPSVGSQIRLTLYFPDHHPPLSLTRTIVTWVAGDFFGVKFPTLTAKESHRVQQHMENYLRQG